MKSNTHNLFRRAISTSLMIFSFPTLTFSIPTYPDYDHPWFSLSPLPVLTNAACANSTYPTCRPSIIEVQAAIQTLQLGVQCSSAPEDVGCNTIASYADARISLCGYGGPQDCGGIVKQTAEALVDACEFDGEVGGWTRSRSGNGVVIWKA